MPEIVPFLTHPKAKPQKEYITAAGARQSCQACESFTQFLRASSTDSKDSSNQKPDKVFTVAPKPSSIF
jgi:hypothetical protein